MTIVEVVVASAILFFIMTAILGLVGRTTLMSAQAKQMNDANNAISTYVEWMRTLPFTQLTAIESTTIPAGDYTVQIVPTVQDSDNEYLKNVSLGVTVTQPNGFLRVINTMVVIRDRDQYMAQSSQGPLTDPTVIFLAASPPDQTVVWLANGSSYWKDSSSVTRPLQVSARATATEGRTVDEVYFQLEDTYDLKDAVSGEPARWLNPTWTDSPLVNVNLAQVDSDGVPIFRDGLRTVQVFVRDSNGVIRQDVRQYLVDNKAPSRAPDIRYTDMGPGTQLISWDVVEDGTTPAYKYYVTVRRQPMTPPTTALSSWPVFRTQTGPATAYTMTYDPMSRFCAYGAAISPRDLFGPYGSVVIVTRPQVGGSYTINRRTATPKGWTVTTSLTATAPSFESTGTTYTWYEGSTQLAKTDSNTYAPPAVSVDGDPATTPFPARSYSVIVTTEPLGYPAGTANAPVSRTSNTVTTVANVTGTYTFTEGTW
jgi:Tfp pilus assembly protein PilV